MTFDGHKSLKLAQSPECNNSSIRAQGKRNVDSCEKNKRDVKVLLKRQVGESLVQCGKIKEQLMRRHLFSSSGRFCKPCLPEVC